MALTQIDFTDEQEEIISEVSKEFKLNKPKAVRRIVECYKEVKNDKS